ncbi:acyl-CoA dehydrogenase [Pseudonocardiaceae bacterium YIM PH 21723]|nr:acyl-CoA dehydrogenase [Pseudonocardiaceae bacterium YIM PH 21723]
MGHYKSNLRDLEFNLFELFKVQELLGTGPFAQSDEESARAALGELASFAEGPLAAPYAEADRNPPVFDPKTHTVKIPDAFKKSFKELIDGEWWRGALPEELGGLGVTPSVQWAMAEMMVGSNPAAFIFMAGPSFASILHANGNDEQKRWAEIMIEKRWGATMVLTEPDAGSDVGAGRTTAEEQPDGTYHIDGVKRFISGAAQDDMTENIIHLTLARPKGAGPGTKGLSLFVVPEFLFDRETGEVGEHNGVYVTNVEHKMGLKASTTCELTFGQHGKPAVGYLVGDVHNGIAQMFQVIENARMLVGTKAISTLSTGYLNALAYAKERVQSADLTQMTDKTAPRVTITHHPDVRRTLMLQKAYAEGLRAVYIYTATFQDKIRAGKAAGEDVSQWEGLNDLLLPIVKGVGSERVYEMLNHSLQIFGGSGFLQDYPIEQYVRDAKIDSLYEGTTAIQSLDFFFRKIIRDKGKALGYINGEIQSFIDNEAGNGQLKQERELLSQALQDLQGMLGGQVGFLTSAQEDVRNIYKVGQNTVRVLMSTGDVLISWLLLRQAELALTKLDGDVSAKDKAFYEGKVAAASFFAKNVLPELSARRKSLEATDNALMDLDEAAF